MYISRKKLKSLRVEKQITQEQLAKMLGFASYSTVSAWESGRQNIPEKYFKELEQILGSDIYTEYITPENPKNSLRITPEIHEALWQWYRDSEMTQETLAELLEIKHSTLNHWLNGRSRSMRGKTWNKVMRYIAPYLQRKDEKIAEELNVQLEDLLGDEEVNMRLIDPLKVDYFLENSLLKKKVFCEMTGLLTSHYKKYIEGKLRIPPSKYAKIATVLNVPIEKLLGEEEDKSINPLFLKETNGDYSVERADPSKMGGMFLPVISDAAASAYHSPYIPIADWVDEHAEKEKVWFSRGKPGDFVVRVTGDSMSPWYPHGTLMLVRPNTRLKNGDRVNAILSDGDSLCKIFVETDDEVCLLSIDGDGRDLYFPKDDASNKIRALYKVIQSQRVEDDIDQACELAGIRPEWETKIEKRKAKK